MTIIKQYLAGASIRELAIEYSTTRHFIKKELQLNNIPLRTSKEQAVIQGQKQSGINHPNWNGGLHFNKKQNEMMILINGKYHKLSHYNWCIHNNFPIIPNGMDIHHLNKDHLDNRPENLIMLPHDIHTSLHRRLEAEANK